MTPEELILNTETQILTPITVDTEKCKRIKNHIEGEHAPYILSKDIVPVTRWFLKNIKTDIEYDLSIGDQLEYVDLEQSFDYKNNYKGSIRATIVDLEPKHLKVATPQKTFYLMGTGTKILGYHKPLHQMEIDPTLQLVSILKEQNSKKLTFTQLKSLIILIGLISSILIFSLMMLL